MQDASNEQTPVVREYLQVLSRRRWVVLFAVLAVPLAAVVLSLRQEARYEAVADVLLPDETSAATFLGKSSGSGDPVRDLETQAELARSSPVARAAVERSGLRHFTAEDLLAASQVKAAPNSNLLQFVVTAGDARSAERLATAYAREFASFRRELTASGLSSARGRIEQQLRALPVDSTTGAARADLRYQIQQLRTAEALQTSANLIARAASSAAQVQPRPVRNAVMGFALALIVGVGLAFLFEAVDIRVRSEEEVQQILDAPLLGRLPPPDPRSDRASGLSMLDAPDGARADAVRVVKKNLEFAAQSLDFAALTPKAIMVGSALPGEGKSTTVAELAVAFGRGGWRVLVADLDLRRPTLPALLGVFPGPGITEVVFGQVTLDDALVPVSLERGQEVAWNGDRPEGSVALLRSGAIPRQPGEFVESEALEGLLGELRNRADLVLVDSTPLLGVGDSLSVAELVDALVLVMRLDNARRPTINELGRVLDSTPTPVLGTILSGVPGGDRFGGSFGSDPTPRRPRVRPARVISA
jgi:polysaccharide biosynthesis transport protein